MRKFWLIVVISICACLTSCVYSKITVIRLNGDKVTAPIMGYVPIQGEGVKGVIIRQVFITDEKDRTIPKLSDIVIKDSGDNTGDLEITK